MRIAARKESSNPGKEDNVVSLHQPMSDLSELMRKANDNIREVEEYIREREADIMGLSFMTDQPPNEDDYERYWDRRY